MRKTASWLIALGALVVVGCGGGGTTVSGTVTRGGKPVTLSPQEGININLSQEEGQAGGSGTVNPDGSFKITNYDGSGLPPGKYKVSLTVYAPPSNDPKKPTPPPRNIDTKMVWTVGGAGQDYSIDLDKFK